MAGVPSPKSQLYCVLPSVNVPGALSVADVPLATGGAVTGPVNSGGSTTTHENDVLALLLAVSRTVTVTTDDPVTDGVRYAFMNDCFYNQSGPGMGLNFADVIRFGSHRYAVLSTSYRKGALRLLSNG